MPKIFDRRLILSVLEQQMAMAIAIHEDDDLLEDFCDAYVLINNSRYMNTRVRSPHSTEFLLSCALNLNITKFKQNFRFVLLFGVLDIMEMGQQLQCSLCFLALVSELLFCLPAELSLLYCRLRASTFRGLLKKDELRSDKRWRLRGFLNVLVSLMVLLFLYPRNQPLMVNVIGTAHRYSINMQIVCDVDRRIIGFSCGWPGSMHDAGLWRRSVQAKNPNKFFRKGEHIIGDSAYGVSKFLIPAFKSPAADIHMNKEFNYLLAKSRVRNEHSIGILKGRWSCLREHRQQIRSSNDVQAIIRVSTACVILHNMLANLGDSWEEMFREVDPVDVSVAENVEGNDMGCASSFREEVKSYAIEKGYINGILPIDIDIN